MLFHAAGITKSGHMLSERFASVRKTDHIVFFKHLITYFLQHRTDLEPQSVYCLQFPTDESSFHHHPLEAPGIQFRFRVRSRALASADWIWPHNFLLVAPT